MIASSINSQEALESNASRANPPEPQGGLHRHGWGHCETGKRGVECVWWGGGGGGVVGEVLGRCKMTWGQQHTLSGADGHHRAQVSTLNALGFGGRCLGSTLNAIGFGGRFLGLSLGAAADLEGLYQAHALVHRELMSAKLASSHEPSI